MNQPPPPDLNGLSVIADRLKAKMFSSKTVVEIDSIIVSSLFGQRAEKKKRRKHLMQTLSCEYVVDQETRDNIYHAFEENKEDLVFDNPAQYFKAANDIAASLYRGSSLLKRQGKDSKAVIEWCISAYSMVINPQSCVKLSCIKMGPAETLGFAVHAVTEIPSGREIRELVGLMPKDNKTKHSEVSCITPSSDHNQSTRVERVLFGPIRFINHICMTPNTEFIAIAGSSAFYVVAKQDIAPGEELFLDYGKEWFADEPGGCPCRTCKPDQQVKKRQKDEKDAATIQAEREACRKAKRKRRGERKSKKRNENNRPTTEEMV